MKYIIQTSLILLFTILLSKSYGQDTIGKLTFETRYQLRKDSSYVPNLQFRYFIKNNSALRVGIAYQYSSVTREVHESGGEGVGTVEKLNSMFLFAIGYEKHFKRKNISPYVGGEFNFGIGKSEEYGLRTDSLTFIADYNYSIKRPVNQFGVHLFSGVDVYLFENLYIGTELGVAFVSKEIKRGEFKSEDGSSSTSAVVTENIPSIKSKLFDITNVGVIRVGWRF